MTSFSYKMRVAMRVPHQVIAWIQKNVSSFRLFLSSANVYYAAPGRSVPAAGIEFGEQDTPPHGRGFQAAGEPGIKCVNDTNKCRIAAVV